MNRLVLFLWFCGLVSAGAITLSSPDGKLSATIEVDGTGALVYSLQKGGQKLISPSRIGVTVNGVDLGTEVDWGAPVFGKREEHYPLLGKKSEGFDHANTVTIPVSRHAGGLTYSLEVRAFDDGFAWRLVVPGTGTRQVTDEATSWTLPAGSKVWFYERNSDWKLKSYAGFCTATEIEKLPTISAQGPVQCPPLVAELPEGAGYLALTEAALANYSGMRLRALPGNRLQADFSEGAKGFAVEGTITTPWRVTLVAVDLNQLVNSDVISSLNDAPDPALFAHADYIKPGRSVWRWWSEGTGNFDQERKMIDLATELGFEYSLVDEGWRKWTDPWKRIAELCADGRKVGVGVFIWEDSKNLKDPANQFAQVRSFLDSCHDAGVAGVKIDFFNSEAKTSIDFQRIILRLAAERRLMVAFHGLQKPTGESRTFPNEITREAIRGLELNLMPEGPITATHNAALPFTRYLAGHADYTPLGYSKPGKTTWAQQLATVVQATSPLLVIAENPDKLLHDPAMQPGLDVLKAIPSTWDETRVLAPSRIGELAVIARRKGKDWFLASLNGDAPVKVPTLDLSFLGPGTYRAIVIASPSPHALARQEREGVTSATPWSLELTPGDGQVVWFQAGR